MRERDENQFRSDEKIVLLLPEPFNGFSIWSKYELSFVSLIFISVVFVTDTDSVGTRNPFDQIRVRPVTYSYRFPFTCRLESE